MTKNQDHWVGVYSSKSVTDVSWFRPHLDVSLALIDKANLSTSARIIDVGGGASTLVDDLLARGFENITILDIAAEAMTASRARLGLLAERVTWIAADVTNADLPRLAFDLWHDRAVFHFLTDPAVRKQYVMTAGAAIKPGGQLVIGTFGPDGPLKCSGLEIVRYDVDRLAAQFADEFDLLDHKSEIHVTPSGREQSFVYCRLEKRKIGAE